MSENQNTNARQRDGISMVWQFISRLIASGVVLAITALIIKITYINK